jgi:hypothetical protein
MGNLHFFPARYHLIIGSKPSQKHNKKQPTSTLLPFEVDHIMMIQHPRRWQPSQNHHGAFPAAFKVSSFFMVAFAISPDRNGRQSCTKHHQCWR